MTGFAPSVQGDVNLLSNQITSEASPCDCHPAHGDYCSLGEGLVRSYVEAVCLNDQYGDRLPFNIAVFTLSVHWGLDRAATLLALLNNSWFGRASARGSCC